MSNVAKHAYTIDEIQITGNDSYGNNNETWSLDIENTVTQN